MFKKLFRMKSRESDSPVCITINNVEELAEIPKGERIKAVWIGRGESLPAREFAPVVRCKDCQFWSRHSGVADSPNGQCFCHDICMNQNDFCSYGMLKEQDNV